jgi:hypothetical protein
MARAVVLEGKVVARESEQLGVMLEVPDRSDLVYLTAAQEIFRALHPGLRCKVKVENGVVVSFQSA